MMRFRYGLKIKLISYEITIKGRQPTIQKDDIFTINNVLNGCFCNSVWTRFTWTLGTSPMVVIRFILAAVVLLVIMTALKIVGCKEL